MRGGLVASSCNIGRASAKDNNKRFITTGFDDKKMCNAMGD
jgi:hypothetical protein